MSSTIFKGVVHGKTIELDQEPGMPDGQKVGIELHALVEEKPESRAATAIPPVETWMDRLVFDRAIHPLERIVKGTRLEVEALVAELAAGSSDAALRLAHPELTAEDVAALRNYALAPVTFRRLFGAWADDAEELDQFLKETRRARKLTRRGIEE
jgi:uncharacterized protein (DUF433 family)